MTCLSFSSKQLHEFQAAIRRTGFQPAHLQTCSGWKTKLRIELNARSVSGSYVRFITCLIGILTVIPSFAEKPAWEIRDTHFRFCKYLRTPEGDLKDALKDRDILEIRGTYHFAGDGVLNVKDISLKLPGSDEKPMLLGIGMPAIVAAASYVYPEKAGAKGSSISSTRRGKFELKEQPDGAITVTLLQSPTQLSLAFDVPKESSTPYNLCFGPVTFSVPDAKPVLVSDKPVEQKTTQQTEPARPEKRSAEVFAASRLGMAKQLLKAGKQSAAWRILKDVAQT